MGIKPAPAALNCSLRKLFRQHAIKSPQDKAYMQQLEDTAYVDDVPIVGEQDHETLNKVAIARAVVAEGLFTFSKFTAYPPRLAAKLGQTTQNDTFKILGVGFDPATDQLFIRLNGIDEFRAQQRITKRQAASLLARAFDPLGLAAPAFVAIKQLRQNIDVEHPKKGWNTMLTRAATQDWHAATVELQHLSQLRVDRQVAVKDETHRDYHGFADASETAIGVCILCVSYNARGEVKCTLIFAKSKITPRTKSRRVKPDVDEAANKVVTYPSTPKILRTGYNQLKPEQSFKVNRAELTAALLLAEMWRRISPALTNVRRVAFWTDSAVTLTWIRNRRHTGVSLLTRACERCGN
jgi:hypothetical protein